MLKRLAPLFAVALISACAAESSETVGATNEALGSPLSGLSVTSLGTSMVFTYTASGAAFSITLNGPGGATKTATLSTPQTQTAEFDGLTPCTAYPWSIQSAGTVVASGSTNTRLSGLTGLCSASETILASMKQNFQGMQHEEDQNLFCGNWVFGNMPANGYGWHYDSQNQGGYSTGEFGYQHFDNGSDHCTETMVHAWRSQLQYVVSPDQWSRGVTNATFNATLTSGSPTNCVDHVSGLYVETWPIPAGTDGLWAGLVGGPENQGLAVSSAQPTYPLVVSGNQISSNFGKPQYSTILAGFQANDGFADLNYGASQSWARETHDCLASFTNASLTLQYSPLPAETPINCTAAVVCGTATVTCNWSPDVFELFASDPTHPSHVVSTLDATSGPRAITLTDPAGSTAESYAICTVNSAGTRVCGPLTYTSAVACPPTPSCTMATTCTNTASPPTLTVTCSTTADFYTDDSYTGTINLQSNGLSFTRTTDSTLTTESVLACAQGYGPTAGGLGPRCTSFSTYVPKTSWCGRPPPPPVCGAKPTAKCSVGWVCCGLTDGWECGVCN